MDYSTKNIKKFVYSHYFYGGVRQALGALVPAMVLLGLFDLPVLGLAATFGAMCVSIVDQPGPVRHRKNEMLGCAVLGAATAGITALATPYAWGLWFTVIGLCFFLSLLSVFGRKGGLIGFACMLLMTLTMHSDFTPGQALLHTVVTIAGGLWYTGFSLVVTRLQWYRQEQQAIAACIFASAEYLEVKARFYDPDVRLEDNYQQLIVRQAAVAEQQEAARDVVLRELPRAASEGMDARRARMFKMFIDIVDLHETVVAVHTDYELLRRVFAGSDLLVFFHDLLHKLALDTEAVGLAITQDRITHRHINVKAELRAIEYEIDQLKKADFPKLEPEAYTALIWTFRRARNASHILDRLHRDTDPASDGEASSLKMDASLRRFLSKQDFSPARITSNLKLSSPNFRHALRVTLAVAIGMTISSEWLIPHHIMHSYWIVLTIVVIMKPGFSLSKQRNVQRLTGTLIGCALVLALLSFVDNTLVLFAAMMLAAVMGNSLVQLYYLASATFNTTFVLLAFHFIAPGSLSVIGERALDTLVGSIIALGCSYFLPYWEYRLIKPAVQRAIAANRNYLSASQQLVATGVAQPADDVDYRLARKNVHIAFGNFANSFYRMMLEPRSKQRSVAELNNLVIQNHELAAQIGAAAPLLATLPAMPPPLAGVARRIEGILDDAVKGTPDTRDDSEVLRELARDLDSTVLDAEATGSVDGDTVHTLRQLVFQLKQMAKTSLSIRRSAAFARLPA
ncbi:FUSC family protein [Pigmentiphaga litoralis]|uniref:FUSC family protein n=1 Tax=Pigmentiphaga litoralis TaxID=516702 RepID=UPI003B43CF68